MLEQAQIGRELGRGLRDARQGRERLRVDLARIGLAGNRHHAREAEVVRNALFQLLDLGFVAVEQLHEGRLRAGRALAAQHAQVLDTVFDLAQVHEQLVHPQGRALADRGQLRGLEVGEAERRLRLVRVRKLRELVQHGRELFAHEQQALADLDDIGVVAHIGARRAEVDDARRLRCGLAKGVNVRHNVVADFLFARPRGLVVDVGQVCFHLVHLLLCDGQAERHLGFRQRHPQAAPGRELHIRGEGVEHLLRGIARGKRAFIHVVHVSRPFRSVDRDPVMDRFRFSADFSLTPNPLFFKQAAAFLPIYCSNKQTFSRLRPCI